MSSFPELRGSLFCDPHFVENYLSVDPTRLEANISRCASELNALRFSSVTRSSKLYELTISILGTINQAVCTNSEEASIPSVFVSGRAETIPSYEEGADELQPDLVLLDGEILHWENVKMAVEIKPMATHLKSGMRQLAKSASAVFSNQLHRRHQYGTVFCGWEATFVRFDRSGVIYSAPIDIRDQAFCEAFTGLMMLDKEAFGYDTAFTTRPTSNGGLDYYVDLPANAFPSEGRPDIAAKASTAMPRFTGQPNAPLNVPIKRLKVVRLLCHRKSICGNGTIVLRVREVIQPGVSNEGAKGGVKTRVRMKLGEWPTKDDVEVLGTRDYVLKLMWRDPNKKVEGEVLERLVGVYGVAQYMWHSDVFKKCDSLGCMMSMDYSCGNCLDKTPSRENLLVAKDLMDLDSEMPEGAGNKTTQYRQVDTDKFSLAHVQWRPRVYCRLLTSTLGSPLYKAESPRQLLRAILDAIIGYWRLVNMGLLHRDISEGNVLMLREGDGYHRRDWELPRKATSEEDSVLSKSERLLRKVLHDLGRDPVGMLNDFDLSKVHNLMGVSFFGNPSSENWNFKADPEKISRSTGARSAPSTTPKESRLNHANKTDKYVYRVDYRAGTPTYMSTRVLKVKLGEQYDHHFVDDLESFFWLILWCVAEHVDAPGAYLTREAQELLESLDRERIDDIAASKVALLANCQADGGYWMWHKLEAFDNSWASDPAIASVIINLGSFFYSIFLSRTELLPKCSPDEVFPVVVGIISEALELGWPRLSPF
ncbi:hypothetical protein FRC12_020093 [Ceratobasidium sp. 428]|nr:hypothetical protein FRC12_020093 [Ceratobasidium sp. 428]